MVWSLSEFLGLIDVRGVCWGAVDMGEADGFRVGATDAILFYGLVEGRATVHSTATGAIDMSAGDAVVMFSKTAHTVQAASGSRLHTLDFLKNDEYRDIPGHIRLSQQVAARMICGRLKVRWPAGLNPKSLPPSLTIPRDANVVDLQRLVGSAGNCGASAVLTRTAGMLMILGMHNDPGCQTVFREANFRDPISRSIQYMEIHPHRYWNVAMLASKVGMARSTFAARFLSEVGKPPMEMLTQIRMNRAAELLDTTSLKVAEVAERVGYNSQSAFNRRFEKAFGTTPGKRRSEAGPATLFPASSRPHWRPEDARSIN